MSLRAFAYRIKRRVLVTIQASAYPKKPEAPPWQGYEGESFQVRAYRTYSDYVEQQKSKVERLLSRGEKSPLVEYDIMYRALLHERLRDGNLIPVGSSVLCLAARIGTEVKSFLDLGCFAVGLDLNPGPGNKYVVHGDFHEIQFATQSIDSVFTNSLDHVLDIEAVLTEIKRLLKPEGLLIIEAVQGSAEGISPGVYESFFWPTVDVLVAFIEQQSFQLIRRVPFEYPWGGQHLVFRKLGA